METGGATASYLGRPLDLVPSPALLAPRLHSLRLLPTARYSEAIVALGPGTGESVSVGMLVARHESEHRLSVVATIGDVIAPHRMRIPSTPPMPPLERLFALDAEAQQGRLNPGYEALAELA